MARLDVQAVYQVSDYDATQQDILMISVSVCDANGDPVSTLTKDNFSLFLDGGTPNGTLEDVTQGTVMLEIGLYDLFFKSFPPPSHFENGTGAVVLTVTNGADRGQTIFNVTVDGRPVSDED
jgi:hypothetical protein